MDRLQFVVGLYFLIFSIVLKYVSVRFRDGSVELQDVAEMKMDMSFDIMGGRRVRDLLGAQSSAEEVYIYSLCICIIPQIYTDAILLRR